MVSGPTAANFGGGRTTSESNEVANGVLQCLGSGTMCHIEDRLGRKVLELSCVFCLIRAVLGHFKAICKVSRRRGELLQLAMARNGSQWLATG